MNETPKSGPPAAPEETPEPSVQKTAGEELKDGLFKMLGAAKRFVDEIPTKPLEDLVLKGADAAKEAAKQVTKDLPTERIAASPTYQRIEEAVKTGAREVSRAVENVASTAWDNVRGVTHEPPPPGAGERIDVPSDDDKGGPPG